MPKFIVKITDADSKIDDNAECFLTSDLSIAQKLKSLGKLVLLEGERAAGMCLAAGADGIIADLSQSNSIKKDIAILRTKIGQDAILGVVARARRHEAMTVSENEPDFIVFRVWEDGKEKMVELSKWYSELFLIEQAIELCDDKVDYRDFYADMVILVAKK